MLPKSIKKRTFSSRLCAAASGQYLLVSECIEPKSSMQHGRELSESFQIGVVASSSCDSGVDVVLLRRPVP